MIRFLKLIRWKNLVMIGLCQALIKYALLTPLKATTSLRDFEFALLVLATLCIAAAGNVINDINDIATDTINRPEKVVIGKGISEAFAFKLFIGLSVVGVALGFYISNVIEREGFSTIFILASALLYIYSTSLKEIVIVGNLAVSLLVALSLVIVGLFELLPAINPENQIQQIQGFKLILGYALFALLINMMREMVKDIEDLKGDSETGLKTLPILIGRKFAGYIIFCLAIAVLGSILYYTINYLYLYQSIVLYVIFAIAGPTLYFTIKILSAETVKEIHTLSVVLKLIMLTGMLSILFYPSSLC